MLHCADGKVVLRITYCCTYLAEAVSEPGCGCVAQMEAALGPLPPALRCMPARAHGGRHGALMQGLETLPPPPPCPTGIKAAGPLRSGVVDHEPGVASRAAPQARLPWPPRPPPSSDPSPDPGTALVARREPLPSWAEALPPLGAELARVDRSAADLILRLLIFDPARHASAPRGGRFFLESPFLRGVS